MAIRGVSEHLINYIREKLDKYDEDDTSESERREINAHITGISRCLEFTHSLRLKVDFKVPDEIDFHSQFYIEASRLERRNRDGTIKHY